MKPRNREISIFNLSMLDVVSGAMGAFLIIMAVLFPYYKKETIDYQQLIQQLRHQNDDLQRQLAQAREQAEQQQQRAEAAEQKLAKTFLVVYIRWGTKWHDVDLHVLDPAGVEFSFRHRTDPNRPGELSEDSQTGPGNEVWEIHQAPAGRYRIYANLYDRNGNSASPSVKGRIIYRDGSAQLDAIELAREDDKVLMATVLIAADGSVMVQ